ncbi:unnamed protein product [Closterium sp. NIES-53]
MERYGVTGGRTVMTPFPAGFKLKKAAEEDDVLEDEQRNEYQSLIGSVMYAAVHTRPDASFGVGQLARVVQRPTEEQLEVAKRLVRYLGSTASAGVQFSAGGQLKQIGADGVTPGNLKLSCFTDATWASEDEDQSSVGGFVCMVGDYMAMYHAIKEIVLLRKLLEDMGAEQEGPTPLFSDSEAAIGMANNPILNGLNKHMKIKWHWVRQMVKEGIVELHHVKASKIFSPRDFPRAHIESVLRSFLAIPRAPLLSQSSGVATFYSWPISSNTLLSQITSFTPWNIAMYYDSTEESAVSVCFLDLQLTGPPTTTQMYPPTDEESSFSEAHVALVKQVRNSLPSPSRSPFSFSTSTPFCFTCADAEY